MNSFLMFADHNVQSTSALQKSG